MCRGGRVTALKRHRFLFILLIVRWINGYFPGPFQLATALQVGILNTLFIGTFNLNLWAGFHAILNAATFTRLHFINVVVISQNCRDIKKLLTLLPGPHYMTPCIVDNRACLQTFLFIYVCLAP